MKKSNILAISVLAMAAALTSCSNYSDTYTRSEVGEARTVKLGTVTSVADIRVKADDHMTGTLVGAGAGGVAGAMLGGGNAKYATAAGGAILGSIAGQQIDKAVTTETWQRIGVRLDDKTYQEISQPKNKSNPIFEGQRVQVLLGTKGSRVIPSNY